ncbi:MAG: glutamine amidotransferase-like uncharacterized protein [Verrucomicrobiales bacterium]|jgi:glutamine amidotransferase-like uncharacterized protein
MTQNQSKFSIVLLLSCGFLAGCTNGTGSSGWAYQSDSGAYNSQLYDEQVEKLTKSLFDSGKFESEGDAERRAREIIQKDADENLRRHQAGQDNFEGSVSWEKDLGD